MKERQKILVVDDEEKILELISSYLEADGYEALRAKNGREAMDFFTKYSVSLILLDLMLPGLSGEEVCRQIRKVSNVPVIMITAKADEEHIIHGLNIGADDYVCKPFSPRQLMARVQAALRRVGENSAKTLVYGDLAADMEKRSVKRGGETVVLTRDEFNILTLLMSRQAKIFTRDEILDHIKGDDYDGFDRAIDTHIKNIRAKIGDDPKAPKYIATVYGMGYRFGVE
jgi:DNA-binding response OmpR family regulator